MLSLPFPALFFPCAHSASEPALATPKALSKHAEAFHKRSEKREVIKNALDWCLKNDKSYRAATQAGVIPATQEVSLKRALKKHKINVEREASGLTKVSAEEAIRRDLDGRMVRHRNSVCVCVLRNEPANKFSAFYSSFF